MSVRLGPRLPTRFSPIPILTLALVGCGNSLSLPADGQPTALAVVSGDRQRGRAGAALDNPLVVRLTDAVGRPVMGAAVGFRFLSPTTGGQVTSAVTTDSTGRAATKVVLAGVPGTQRIEAHVDAPGSDPTATFTLDATTVTTTPPANPSGDGAGGGDGSGGGNGNGRGHGNGHDDEGGD